MRANRERGEHETENASSCSGPNGDPDAGYDAWMSVRHARFPPGPLAPTPETVTVDAAELATVLSLAEGYLDLTMYELGQGCCVGKLRDIWRARRARVASNENS